jgi:flagellar FliJ protein
MKPFTFRLERILALRARAERERARDLGEALRDEEARRTALREAVARLRRCGEQAQATAGEVTTAGALHAIGLTVKAVADDLEAAADSHRAAEAALTAETERFGEARRDRRVVERLRERREAAWDLDAARHEQKECDNLAQRRPGREDAT